MRILHLMHDFLGPPMSAPKIRSAIFAGLTSASNTHQLRDRQWNFRIIMSMPHPDEKKLLIKIAGSDLSDLSSYQYATAMCVSTVLYLSVTVDAVLKYTIMPDMICLLYTSPSPRDS